VQPSNVCGLTTRIGRSTKAYYEEQRGKEQSQGVFLNTYNDTDLPELLSWPFERGGRRLRLDWLVRQPVLVLIGSDESRCCNRNEPKDRLFVVKGAFTPSSSILASALALRNRFAGVSRSTVSTLSVSRCAGEKPVVIKRPPQPPDQTDVRQIHSGLLRQADWKTK